MAWARIALLVFSVGGALGAGGSGIFFGLPHFMNGNYSGEERMIPFIVVFIAINICLSCVLAFATWLDGPQRNELG